MDAQLVFETMAKIIKACDPPGLKIGSLNGLHANYGNVDGIAEVRCQAKWRPPNIEVGLAFDNSDPRLNNTRCDRLASRFAPEVSVGVLSREDAPVVQYLLRAIPINRYRTAQELAEDAAITMLYLMNRSNGALAS
jgi:hypothetical protein